MKPIIAWHSGVTTLAAGDTWATARTGKRLLFSARGGAEMNRLSAELADYWSAACPGPGQPILGMAELTAKDGFTSLVTGHGKVTICNDAMLDFSNWVDYACGKPVTRQVDDSASCGLLAAFSEQSCRDAFARLCRALASEPHTSTLAGLLGAVPGVVMATERKYRFSQTGIDIDIERRTSAMFSLSVDNGARFSIARGALLRMALDSSGARCATEAP